MPKKKSYNALYKKTKKEWGKSILQNFISIVCVPKCQEVLPRKFSVSGILNDVEFPVKDRKPIILVCLYGCLKTGLCRAMTCHMSCIDGWHMMVLDDLSHHTTHTKDQNVTPMHQKSILNRNSSTLQCEVLCIRGWECVMSLLVECPIQWNVLFLHMSPKTQAVTLESSFIP